MAYRDYIKSEQQKWIGRTVYYEGQRYMVVDVDYNGMLLINKPTMLTDTTAVETWQVITMTDIELMQILKEIADDCYYRRNCDGCKFDNNGQCILSGTPESWDIEQIESEDEE